MIYIKRANTMEQRSKSIDSPIMHQSVLFQPLVHSVSDLDVVLLHEKHVSVTMNALLTQIRILYVYAYLLQILDSAVIVWRMERCFASDDKFWDFAQVGQLLRWGLLHDALVVIGVDCWLDGCLNV